jgi:hypothetical protein
MWFACRRPSLGIDEGEYPSLALRQHGSDPERQPPPGGETFADTDDGGPWWKVVKLQTAGLRA